MKHSRCPAVLALAMISARWLFADVPKEENYEDKINALMVRMTIEEKAGQLTQIGASFDGTLTNDFKSGIRDGKIGSLLLLKSAHTTNEAQRIAVEQSRLHIPLIFSYDVLHGFRTVFPIPLAQASSWDPSLFEQSSSIAAEESSAVGIRWIFAPMVDVARDPRWGRIAEGAGEDPLLGSVMAAAAVRGFQKPDSAGFPRVASCLKHFVGYGAVEGGRDYNSVDISERTLREVYLPPFRAAIAAGALTVMSAFPDRNGVPVAADPSLLKNLLRGELGFAGLVVSDWNAVQELTVHGVAATPEQAAEKALSAGVDIDMEDGLYSANLPALVQRGKVSPETVDEAVRQVLRLKFRLGLFDHPYVNEENEASILLSKPHLAAALDAAHKSIVLLKNEGQLLPLKKQIRSIAVIGPLADDHDAPLGPWSADGKPRDVVSVVDGLKSKLPAQIAVRYAKGCDIPCESSQGFAEAEDAARRSDVALLVLGESARMSGEAASRAFLDLPGRQEELVEALSRTGTPIVVILMNGRPLAISWIAAHVPAIVESWFLGLQSGNAIADVLLGNYNPAGKLPVTFPRAVGQLPVYYNHLNTGRPPAQSGDTSRYLDLPPTPLFPFGFGLSYTDFRYSNLRLSAQQIARTGQVVASVEIENTGPYAGDEIVQLYTRLPAASVSRPVRELRKFQRVTLASGEKRKVEFILRAEDLAFYNAQMKFVVELGTVKVFVGPSSNDGLEASLEISDR